MRPLRRTACSRSCRDRRAGALRRRAEARPHAARLTSSWGPTFVPLYRTRRLTALPPGGRRRPARIWVGGAAPMRGLAGVPAVTIGPADDAVARARARRRRRGEAQRRSSGLVGRLGRGIGALHHLPDRLRAAGRLRRHLSRGDRDASRPTSYRHHARDRASGGAPGRAHACEHAPVHAGRVCTLRSSIRASAAIARAIALSRR